MTINKNSTVSHPVHDLWGTNEVRGIPQLETFPIYVVITVKFLDRINTSLQEVVDIEDDN